MTSRAWGLQVTKPPLCAALHPRGTTTLCRLQSSRRLFSECLHNKCMRFHVHMCAIKCINHLIKSINL